MVLLEALGFPASIVFLDLLWFPLSWHLSIPSVRFRPRWCTWVCATCSHPYYLASVGRLVFWVCSGKFLAPKSGFYSSLFFLKNVWQVTILEHTGLRWLFFSYLVSVDINAGHLREEECHFLTNARFVPVDITALQIDHRVRMSENLYLAGIQQSQLFSSSPSLHGGRGATPSEGGRPSDLSALAGGGWHFTFSLCAVLSGNAPGSPFFFAESEGEKEDRTFENVDHQEGGNSGFHQPATRSSSWMRSGLPRQLLHSWSVHPSRLLCLHYCCNKSELFRGAPRVVTEVVCTSFLLTLRGVNLIQRTLNV